MYRPSNPMGIAPISRGLANAFSVANMMQQAAIQQRQQELMEQRIDEERAYRDESQRMKIAELGATPLTPEQEIELQTGIAGYKKTLDPSGKQMGLEPTPSDLKGRVFSAMGQQYVMPSGEQLREKALAEAKAKGESEGIIAQMREEGRRRGMGTPEEEPGVVLPESVTRALGMELGKPVPQKLVQGLLPIARDMLAWEREQQKPKGSDRKVRSANFATNDKGERTATLVYEDGGIVEKPLTGAGKSKGATDGQAAAHRRNIERRADRLEAQISRLQDKENELHAAKRYTGQKKGPGYSEKEREQKLAMLDEEIRDIQRKKQDMAARIKKIYGEKPGGETEDAGGSAAGTWEAFKSAHK